MYLFPLKIQETLLNRDRLVPGSLSQLIEYLSMDGILGQVGSRQVVPINRIS